MSAIIVLLFFLYAISLTELVRLVSVPRVLMLFLLFAPFVFLVATRLLTVPDTQNYVNYYLSVGGNVFGLEQTQFEIGFQMLNKAIKVFAANSYRVYFAVLTVLNLLIITFAGRRLVRETEQRGITTYELLLFLVLYMAFFGLYYNAIVVRAGVALSLLILTTSYCIQKKKKTLDVLKIAGLLFLLGSVHMMSLLVGLLVVVVTYYSKPHKVQSYFVWWLVIGALYFTNVFGRFADWYISSGTAYSHFSVFGEHVAGRVSYYARGALVSSPVAFKFLFFWGSGFLFMPFISKMPRAYHKYLNIYFVGLFIFGFLRSVLLIERVTDLCLVFSIFLFFHIFRQLQNFIYYYIALILVVFVQVIFVLRIIN